MVIPIQYATIFSARLKGAVLVPTQCEQCSTVYLYQMVRETTGEAWSWFSLTDEKSREEAVKRGQQLLQEKLQGECDPVPCVACGWYQTPMVEVLRYNLLSPLRGLGWTGIVLAAMLLGLYFINSRSPSLTPDRLSLMRSLWNVAIVAGAAGCVLLFARFLVAERYDFNHPGGVEKRRKLARERSVPLEEFLQSGAGVPTSPSSVVEAG